MPRLVATPIDFQGEAHDEGKDGEKPDASGEEGISLHLEQDIDVGIEQRQEGTDEQGCPPEPQQTCQVADEQGDGHEGGNEVCPGKPQVLGEGEQQGVEQAKRQAHEEVLEGMDALLAGDFHEKADDKQMTKVRMIKREAYFAERVACWYCSTGRSKSTPKRLKPLRTVEE